MPCAEPFQHTPPCPQIAVKIAVRHVGGTLLRKQAEAQAKHCSTQARTNT